MRDDEANPIGAVGRYALSLGVALAFLGVMFGLAWAASEAPAYLLSGLGGSIAVVLIWMVCHGILWGRRW